MKTDYNVTRLADSISWKKSRLLTLELTYPRWIHSEIMTHRSHSKNAASSRAIPVMSMVETVQDAPSLQEFVRYNEKGMQGYTEVSEEDRVYYNNQIEILRQATIQVCTNLASRKFHKQNINRYLEPFSWITVIATGTGKAWKHLLSLRCHEAAEPHFQKLAKMIEEVYHDNEPEYLEQGDWHLPLCNPLSSANWEDDERLSLDDQIKCCVGRCARVSYNTHSGVRDPDKDIALHDQLIRDKHWTPTEHAARVPFRPDFGKSAGGNFGSDWIQYRKTFSQEFTK